MPITAAPQGKEITRVDGCLKQPSAETFHDLEESEEGRNCQRNLSDLYCPRNCGIRTASLPLPTHTSIFLTSEIQVRAFLCLELIIHLLS